MVLDWKNRIGQVVQCSSRNWMPEKKEMEWGASGESLRRKEFNRDLIFYICDGASEMIVSHIYLYIYISHIYIYYIYYILSILYIFSRYI